MTHSMVISTRQPGDLLIYENDITHTFRLGSTIIHDVPIASEHIITEVEVTDGWADGTGGYTSILSGGIGFHFVLIRLESQWSRGFRFKIRVWARRENEYERSSRKEYERNSFINSSSSSRSSNYNINFLNFNHSFKGS